MYWLVRKGRCKPGSSLLINKLAVAWRLFEAGWSRTKSRILDFWKRYLWTSVLLNQRWLYASIDQRAIGLERTKDTTGLSSKNWLAGSNLSKDFDWFLQILDPGQLTCSEWFSRNKFTKKLRLSEPPWSLASFVYPSSPRRTDSWSVRCDSRTVRQFRSVLPNLQYSGSKISKFLTFRFQNFPITFHDFADPARNSDSGHAP